MTTTPLRRACSNSSADRRNAVAFSPGVRSVLFIQILFFVLGIVVEEQPALQVIGIVDRRLGLVYGEDPESGAENAFLTVDKGPIAELR